MSLSLVPTGDERFLIMDASGLDQLQQEQFAHDETYHREIARLTVQRRLTHMTLHFAKYAGYLAEAPDLQREQQILADILIIGLSSANILNMKLSDTIDFFEKKPHISDAEYRNEFLVAAGKMAAACEKLDHLEDFPFRTVLKDSIIKIIKMTLAAFLSKDINVEKVIQKRLSGIRAKTFIK